MDQINNPIKLRHKKNYTIKISSEELFRQINEYLSGTSFTVSEYNYFLDNKRKYYNSFKMIKKNGDFREISAPNQKLKQIQRYILYRHLYNMRPHPSVTGFVRKKSIIHNAVRHINRSHIYNLDLKDFFPTVKKTWIYDFLVKKKYGTACAEILAEVCTLNDSLPQGAPTSPALSNIVGYYMDWRLYGLAKSCKLRYSRYADDMTFSGKYIKKSIRDTIKSIILDCGFIVAENKERLVKKKNNFRQTVTGLVVNKKLSIGTTKYRKLKALLYKCKVTSVRKVQEESRDKHGTGYFLQRDVSDVAKHDFFTILMGHIWILRLIGQYEKLYYALKMMIETDWAEYYRYRYRDVLNKTNMAERISQKRKENIDYKILNTIDKCLLNLKIKQEKIQEKIESYHKKIDDIAADQESRNKKRYQSKIKEYANKLDEITSKRDEIVKFQREILSRHPELIDSELRDVNVDELSENKINEFLMKQYPEGFIERLNIGSKRKILNAFKAERSKSYSTGMNELIPTLENELKHKIYEKFKEKIKSDDFKQEYDHLIKIKDNKIVDSYKKLYKFCFERDGKLELGPTLYIIINSQENNKYTLFAEFNKFVAEIYQDKTERLIEIINSITADRGFGGYSLLKIRNSVHGNERRGDPKLDEVVGREDIYNEIHKFVIEGLWFIVGA